MLVAKFTTRGRSSASRVDSATRQLTSASIFGSLSLLLLAALPACQPTLNAGDLVCPTDPDAGPAPTNTDPIKVGWSTGFENQFCDYTQTAGFCYSDPLDPQATFKIATEPHYVHSGRYAAAFTVNGATESGSQTRCVRSGVLPQAAYYSAWYLLPNPVVVSGNWNLFYFQGGADLSSLHMLWNVTLVNGANGAPKLIAYSPLGGNQGYPTKATVQVPIDQWFFIEFFLERAADATGKVALYLDGQPLFEKDNVITDDASSSPAGRWYVGNLAGKHSLDPPDSTLYVDDIAISATRLSASH